MVSTQLLHQISFSCRVFRQSNSGVHWWHKYVDIACYTCRHVYTRTYVYTNLHVCTYMTHLVCALHTYAVHVLNFTLHSRWHVLFAYSKTYGYVIEHVSKHTSSAIYFITYMVRCYQKSCYHIVPLSRGICCTHLFCTLHMHVRHPPPV